MVEIGVGTFLIDRWLVTRKEVHESHGGGDSPANGLKRCGIVRMKAFSRDSSTS
jgi:hypothetical protein